MTEDQIRLHAEKERSRDEVLFWRPASPVLWNTEEHSHSKGQLFSLQSGLGILKTTAGIWMLPPGRCAWIPPGRRHSMRSGGHITGWAIYLAAPLCNSLPTEPAILSLSSLLSEIVFRISEWKQNPPTPKFRQHLLAVLCDEIQNARQQSLNLPMPSDPRLRRFVEEISKEPQSERNLNAWARFTGMSKRSLLRNFQEETGMTIGQWRQHLRMLVALEKLSNRSSVTETGFAVGYNSVSAFIKTFKRIVGMTPSAYSRVQL
jgi:AraC-like DNA-binding protein/mannose-6-phosphate isomerase-like protein (cupin superfamily)